MQVNMVANMVADMEVDQLADIMVANMEADIKVDKVALALDWKDRNWKWISSLFSQEPTISTFSSE